MPDTPDTGDERTEPMLSRRTALRVGGGGALAITLGGLGGWLDRRRDTTAPPAAAPVPPGTTTPATTTTSTTLAPIDIPEIGEVAPGIIALGRRVIETTGEDDLDALLAQLPLGDDDPIQRAATIVRDEFLASRTITVDGWVLAASEARAAAVIALLCDDASC